MFEKHCWLPVCPLETVCCMSERVCVCVCVSNLMTTLSLNIPVSNLIQMDGLPSFYFTKFQ